MYINYANSSEFSELKMTVLVPLQTEMDAAISMG